MVLSWRLLLALREKGDAVGLELESWLIKEDTRFGYIPKDKVCRLDEARM